MRKRVGRGATRSAAAAECNESSLFFSLFLSFVLRVGPSEEDWRRKRATKAASEKDREGGREGPSIFSLFPSLKRGPHLSGGREPGSEALGLQTDWKKTADGLEVWGDDSDFGKCGGI